MQSDEDATPTKAKHSTEFAESRLRVLPLYLVLEYLPKCSGFLKWVLGLRNRPPTGLFKMRPVPNVTDSD